MTQAYKFDAEIGLFGVLDISQPRHVGIWFEACNWLTCSDSSVLSEPLLELEITKKPDEKIVPATPPDFAKALPESLAISAVNLTAEGIYTYAFSKVISFNESISAEEVALTVEGLTDVKWVEFNQEAKSLIFTPNITNMTADLALSLTVRLEDPTGLFR